MKFNKLVDIDPRLGELLQKARNTRDHYESDYFCANEIWYSQFKPILVNIVGWSAKDARLKSDNAYDIAYNTIYNALPPCRNCRCL